MCIWRCDWLFCAPTSDLLWKLQEQLRSLTGDRDVSWVEQMEAEEISGGWTGWWNGFFSRWLRLPWVPLLGAGGISNKSKWSWTAVNSMTLEFSNKNMFYESGSLTTQQVIDLYILKRSYSGVVLQSRSMSYENGLLTITVLTPPIHKCVLGVYLF